MKFGGSSVKDAERFKEVAEIVKSRLDKKPAVVLSAVKGITDNLILALDESIEDKFDAYEEIVKKHKEILKDLNLDEGLVDDELKDGISEWSDQIKEKVGAKELQIASEKPSKTYESQKEVDVKGKKIFVGFDKL